MKILAVASEIHPFVKTGGLADVVGAMPAAMAEHGCRVTTMVPGYRSIMARIGKAKAVQSYPYLFGHPARLLRATAEGRDLLVLDAPALFDRDGGAYADAQGNDWVDNWVRFAALSAIAADVAGGSVRGFRPDIVHVHDWQAALTLAYMHHGTARDVPGVLTIHNLAFQGRFDAGIFPILGLPADAYAQQGVEYYGGVGYLKAGLHYADAITTVSPTYAHEITTDIWGMGLNGLLSHRRDALSGIINGIDTAEWDPATDPMVPHHFSAAKLAARRGNRAVIEERFGLEPDDSMLITVVSRLTWQKGMDILAQEIDQLIAMGARLVIQGSGDTAIEAALMAAAARHEGRFSLHLGYDEGAAHLLQAGADAILIPSRTEPCGLTQLYGLRYGCVPLVARTGGLADTIIDANEAALNSGVATGFLLQPGTVDGIVDGVERALRLFAEPERWETVQRAGMAADYSWQASAGQYAALFKRLIKARAARVATDAA